MNTHLHYLQRSIQLASYGLGYVNSSPLVGWLFCYNHKIIKEGWLQDDDIDIFFENMHSVSQTGCVLYLSIDPTTFVNEHSTLFSSIASAGIREIVLPSVSESMAKLSQENNIIIRTISLLEKDATTLNIRFCTTKYVRDWHTSSATGGFTPSLPTSYRTSTTTPVSRPYIVLKWAQTADGFIARSNYDSKWISDTYARKLVHQWRSQERAIMVGTNTCLYDNPQLNVRNWSGKDPLRVVLDRHLRLPTSLHVFDGSQPTLCYNLAKNLQQPNLEYAAVSEPDDTNFLKQVLYDLTKRKILSVFVEGGSQLLSLLLKNGWWDEARIFQSTQYFGEGISAPVVLPGELIYATTAGSDRLLIYQNMNRK